MGKKIDSGESKKAMDYLRKNLPREKLKCLCFDPRSLSLRDAKIIVKKNKKEA